jgi:putative nucleotidyltransferase with HDIG domain
MRDRGHDEAMSSGEEDATVQLQAEASIWARCAPRVDEEWFVRRSSLHGVLHTQRVHIHAQRLTRELGWAERDARLVLLAALWHDIGRTHDGVDHRHGDKSVARARRLGLAKALAPEDAASVLFAIRFHCLPDRRAEGEVQSRPEGPGPDGLPPLADPDRALRILWLLKDADALDRIRLGFWESADPRQLRYRETTKLIPFAAALYELTRPHSR